MESKLDKVGEGVIPFTSGFCLSEIWNEKVTIKWPLRLFNKNTGLCLNRKMMYRV